MVNLKKWEMKKAPSNAVNRVAYLEERSALNASTLGPTPNLEKNIKLTQMFKYKCIATNLHFCVKSTFCRHDY